MALVLLSGCWDLREINQLAMVMAVGIDKAPEPGRYVVTIQVARPGAAGTLDTGGGGGGGGATGGSQGPVYTAAADGDTIFVAIRNLAQFTSRRIMWAHNNVVVIGESVALDDITPVMDFFTRNQELRMRTWVVVARGTAARAIVAARTGMEDVPADSISALFRYAHLPGESVRTDIADVAAAFFSRDLHPVIPAMSLSPRAVPPPNQEQDQAQRLQAELRGTAVFRGSRLAGYVDREAGRGLLWLRQEMYNAAVTIPCPGDGDRHMAVEVRSPDVRVTVDVRGEVPVFRVRVVTEGILFEQDCPTPRMQTLELKAYAEREFARKIESSMRAALDRLQGDLQTDAVKFGRLLHVQHPAWWRANRERWDELFPRARVEFAITARIPKMGLYTVPMKFGSP